MAALFNVKILTPEKNIFDGQVESLVVPAALGYAGILANHAPYMTELASGTVIIRDGSGKVDRFETDKSGFMEVINNRATILVNSIEPRT